MEDLKDQYEEEEELAQDELLAELPALHPEQEEALRRQEARLVPPPRAAMALRESARHWDLFYKRNGDRFFKSRHWMVREFPELLRLQGPLLEAGCGAGALLFPLACAVPGLSPLLACDLAPRAVALVRAHPQYVEPRFRAFCTDLGAADGAVSLRDEVGRDGGAVAVTAVFLLSALRWQDGSLRRCASALADALRPGGFLLFRDYARHDMAQLRFGPGHKIRDNLYLRQDGTTSYFFTKEEIRELLTEVGLREERIGYVQRRTTNVKEGIDLPRTFLQACFSKPR